MLILMLVKFIFHSGQLMDYHSSNV